MSKKRIKKLTKSKKSKLHMDTITGMGGGTYSDKGSSTFEVDKDKLVTKDINYETGMVTETFKKDGKTYTTKYPLEEMRRRGESSEAKLPTKTNKKGGYIKKYAKGGGVRKPKMTAGY